MKKLLGQVIAGSLVDGFLIRITNTTDIASLKTGKFVCIASPEGSFFSLITDLRLEVTNPDILLFPPTEQEPLLMRALKKRDMYATAQIRPMLLLDRQHRLGPVKTIPDHFAPVYEADEQDVANIFGNERVDKKFFNVGVPLDMTTPVCLDLERLTERSNGIFGKTGTGKTFLTRLVLAGLIKNNKAVNLIFDMHSEYGLQARKEGGQYFVKGLKTLWPDKVAIFSLDPASTLRRGGSPDVAMAIAYQDIQVDDILSLQAELNVHATAVEAAYLIAARYKKEWLTTLLAQGERLKDFAHEVGAHPESVAALYRKLKRIERLPFLVSQPVPGSASVVDQMIEYLDRGINVIVEFGNYTSTFCYLLIANIITRRIHAQYIQKTEKFLGTQRMEDEPKKLMITIEEAHKFLSPSVAQQTIFGIIAREMRKYYVSLLIVDQRPSGIDDEILSQIGTKIIAQLQDEKDIAAVLSGVSNAQQLRGILSTLDTKKQALLLGHAVTMPVVIQTREYDETFYAAMAEPVTQRRAAQIINEIY